MRKTLLSRLLPAALFMFALAVTAFVAASRVEARGGCRTPCPQPPEGCDFLGCDAFGNCVYDCH